MTKPNNKAYLGTALFLGLLLTGVALIPSFIFLFPAMTATMGIGLSAFLLVAGCLAVGALLASVFALPARGMTRTVFIGSGVNRPFPWIPASGQRVNIGNTAGTLHTVERSSAVGQTTTTRRDTSTVSHGTGNIGGTSGTTHTVSSTSANMHRVSAAPAPRPTASAAPMMTQTTVTHRM